jgi:tape measure domain-containing protein
MATVLKAGAIKIDLEANAKNLVDGFKNAVKSMNTFEKSTKTQTSSSKRLDDQLKALERRKSLLESRMKALDSAGKKNTNTYQNVANQLANVNDRIGTQNIRINEYNGKLNRSSGIVAGFGNALSKMGSIGQNAMQGLFSSINRIAEIAIGNVLANAISRATGMLINFAKSAFGLTVDLQDARGGFEAMLGSAEEAQKMLVALSEYNKKTPFQLPQLQEQAANLLAVGVSADRIIPTLDVLGKISRGNANRMGFLTLAYGQVQTATKLTGAELRQFTENGVPLLDILAQQAGKSVLQIRDDIADGAVSFEMVDRALQSTIQEGGRFYNYFEGQNRNFSFVSSNIIDNLQQVGRSIMGITEEGEIIDGSLFDTMTSGAIKLLAIIEQNRDSIIEFGQNAIQKTIGFVKDLVSFVINLRNSFNQFRDTINNVKTNILLFINTIATYFTPEINSIKNIIDILVTTFKESVLPTLLIIGGVILFLATQVLTALYYAWEVLREPIMQLITSLVELWSAFQPVVMVIMGLIGLIILGLTPILQVLWAVFVQVFAGIMLVVSGAIKIISGIINVFVGFLQGLITGDFSKFRQGFSQIWEGLVLIVRGAIGKTIDAVVAIKDGIINTLKGIDLFKIGVDIIQGLINGIANMAGKLNEKAREIADGIQNQIKGALKIQSPSKVMIQAGLDTGKGLELGLENSQVGIQAQITNISDLIIDSMTPEDNQMQTVNKNKNITVNNYNSGGRSPFVDYSTAF